MTTTTKQRPPKKLTPLEAASAAIARSANIDPITDRAMLVSISVSYWSGKATDDQVEDELTKAHDTEGDVHEYRKRLVKAEALKGFKGVRSRFRAYVKEKTSPWMNDGTRVMASPFYFEMVAKEQEFRAEWDKEVVSFVSNYPKMKGEAKKRLGSLFKEEDYPSVESLRRKFGWEFGIFPVPSSKDWRVDLGKKDDTENVRRQIDEKVNLALAKATRDLWTRLYAVVEKLVVKLKDSEAGFKDSITGNISELIAILPTMNLQHDAQLDQMCVELTVLLSKTSPTKLREDEKDRKATADAADAILKKMAGYIGGDK